MFHGALAVAGSIAVQVENAVPSGFAVWVRCRDDCSGVPVEAVPDVRNMVWAAI